MGIYILGKIGGYQSETGARGDFNHFYCHEWAARRNTSSTLILLPFQVQLPGNPHLHPDKPIQFRNLALSFIFIIHATSCTVRVVRI